MVKTMSTNTNTTNKATVDLRAIKKAEQFLSENHLFGVFYLFCGDMREQGIKEKWDHKARWEAVSTWVGEQDVAADNPFAEKPSGIEGALTEWYEKIYLPSKWTNNNNYRRYNKKGEGQNEASEPTNE
jgi:hypothetical protein